MSTTQALSHMKMCPAPISAGIVPIYQVALPDVSWRGGTNVNMLTNSFVILNNGKISFSFVLRILQHLMTFSIHQASPRYQSSGECFGQQLTTHLHTPQAATPHRAPPRTAVLQEYARNWTTELRPAAPSRAESRRAVQSSATSPRHHHTERYRTSQCLLRTRESMLLVN